ncbi:hypothetical protein GN958_ATG06072 [Phytophthora infestans]|uniref:Uncharacterized protein n=2 Tax=Phytophthora infestans TaxID=4787 RepID=A0A8S9UUP2_PHYIN|nr:hypothetical protein GN958_ATG06072 [Phytophthora infestans]
MLALHGTTTTLTTGTIHDITSTSYASGGTNVATTSEMLALHGTTTTLTTGTIRHHLHQHQLRERRDQHHHDQRDAGPARNHHYAHGRDHPRHHLHQHQLRERRDQHHRDQRDAGPARNNHYAHDRDHPRHHLQQHHDQLRELRDHHHHDQRDALHSRYRCQVADQEDHLPDGQLWWMVLYLLLAGAAVPRSHAQLGGYLYI